MIEAPASVVTLTVEPLPPGPPLPPVVLVVVSPPSPSARPPEKPPLPPPPPTDCARMPTEPSPLIDFTNTPLAKVAVPVETTTRGDRRPRRRCRHRIRCHRSRPLQLRSWSTANRKWQSRHCRRRRRRIGRECHRPDRPARRDRRCRICGGVGHHGDVAAGASRAAGSHRPTATRMYPASSRRRRSRTRHCRRHRRSTVRRCRSIDCRSRRSTQCW